MFVLLYQQYFKRVSFCIRHVLLYSILKQGIWKEIEHWSDTKPNLTYSFSVVDLSPKASYSFRLKLEYSPLKTSFFWYYLNN